MAITTNSDRQYGLTAVVDFAYGDLTSGTSADAVELPSDAIITGGHVYISTAFNSATTDVIIVGDTDDDNEYLTSTSIAALGLTALVPTGLKLSAGKKITVTWTGVGTAPSAGAGQLVINYIRQGRSNENQGQTILDL